MGTAAALGGSAVLGLGGNIFGARASSRANKRAIRSQEAQAAALFDFKRQVFDETKPLRDIGLRRAQFQESLLPRLLSGVDNLDGNSSAAFKLAAQEGLDVIGANASVSGDPFSGPAQITRGRFLSGLAANEAQSQISQEQFRINALLGLAGSAPSPTTGFAQSGDLLQAAGGPTANISDLIQQQGATQAGLFSSAGQTLAQIPFALQQNSLNEALIKRLNN